MTNKALASIFFGAALSLFASQAIAEPIDEAFALCTAPPTQFETVEEGLRVTGWHTLDVAADAQARQQLALAVLMQNVPDPFFGDRVAQIPQVAENMTFDATGNTIILAKPGEAGRDIVSVTRTNSSAFSTSRCLIASHGADNPIAAAQYAKAKNAVAPDSPAWMTQIPLSPQVPGAASANISVTLISEPAREGFLANIVLADTAFDALISFPKEAQ